MRIDLQIPAHLDKEVAADLLLSILEGGEFSSEIQTAMASLSLVGHKHTLDLLLAGEPTEPGDANSAPFTMLWSDSSVRVSSAGHGEAMSADRRVKRGRHSQAGSGKPLRAGSKIQSTAEPHR